MPRAHRASTSPSTTGRAITTRTAHARCCGRGRGRCVRSRLAPQPGGHYSQRRDRPRDARIRLRRNVSHPQPCALMNQCRRACRVGATLATSPANTVSKPARRQPPEFSRRSSTRSPTCCSTGSPPTEAARSYFATATMPEGVHWYHRHSVCRGGSHGTH
jgi:hypothetical protein